VTARCVTALPLDRTAWAWLTREHDTLRAALARACDLNLHPVVIVLAGVMRFLAFKPRGLWAPRLEAESRGLEAARMLGDAVAE
jgi:hypothetical protein